jgi:hypothetical protein
MRKLHDSLREHMLEILALGEHRPPTDRMEALNNNWETLVRRGHGYPNHHYLLAKLRFVPANPVRNRKGVLRIQPQFNVRTPKPNASSTKSALLKAEPEPQGIEWIPCAAHE